MSASRVVEVLQELVGGKLDLLVPPLGCPVLTSDQPHAMNAPEVAVDECVPGLGVVVRSLGESEMPLGILGPGVRFQEGVLVLGTRLYIAPHAVEHVLVRVDEAFRTRNGLPVQGVGGDDLILTDFSHGECAGWRFAFPRRGHLLIA